jgi:class 3 adenylate cyclase/predicted ATPase
MQCSLCGTENRELANFCGGCGALLTLKCPACDTENPRSNKFCNNCGASILEYSTAGPSNKRRLAEALPTEFNLPPGPGANRRQMSLMSCDLVDSSILAHDLDPEDLRDVLEGFHDLSKEVIEEYGGFYAEYLGDGFLSCFGYPVAHEDNAYRAVLTGLKIIEEIHTFNIELMAKYGVELHLRVGVDTGSVLVDGKVIGELPNIANRVQAAANPDTMVITETTRRLLPPDVFTLQDLGVQELKNIQPVRLYRVINLRGANAQVSEPRAGKPLVGRDKQLGLLMELWDRVRAGSGQAVIVAGEAGFGKTKLVQGFEAKIGDEAQACFRFQGSPFHKNTMLHPVIENIQLAAKIVPADTDEEKLSKLNDMLQQFDNPEELLPLVGTLLSVSGQANDRGTAPKRLRQQILDALVEMALQHANRGPTLFVFEDLHWFDSTTMDLLELLVPLIRGERACLVMTTRSTLTPQLQQKYYLTQITLIRLQAREVEHMIQGITGGKALPDSVKEQIVNKANGVPLYVEELTKMVLEADFLRETDDRYDLIGEPEFAIPLALRDPLTSRLDRVKGMKVLQLAATLGGEFSYELLSAISAIDEEALTAELQQLVVAELLNQKGTVPSEATFEFRHSLIRDAAYSLLTNADRKTYHQKIGDILERRFPATVQAHPEIVAYHFAEAKDCEKAVDYWWEAGRQSAARSANKEAVGHLEQALKQLANIEDPKKRNKSELLLQILKGNVLRTMRGWSVDSVRHAYTRALQLSKDNGFDEHTVPAMFGLWTWNFVRATFGEAQALAEDLLSLAERLENPVYKALAHEAQGFTLFARGDFAAAHAELERSIGLCDDDAGVAYLDLSAQDPRVHARLYDGMVLWFLGYPDQALQKCAEASRYADMLQDPFSQTMAKTISLRVHQLRGDAANVLWHADTAIASCEEHGFVHYLAMALVLKGWAAAQQGDFAKGIAEIQSGLEKERSTGGILYESYILALLAEACLKGERFRQALDCLDEAHLRLKEENSESFYAAEIQRLSGEAHLRSRQNSDRAEHHFQEGLAIARKQKARSLELKIGVSLYDLHASQDRAARFHPQLDEIYSGFSEGFETLNLVQAKERLANA